MVWQEKVEKVFMLCSLVEDRSAKCAKYWPDERGSVNFGDITVSNTNESSLSPGLRRRLLTITHRESQETRTVTQVHYTSWPDHGVPSTYDDLKVLLQDMAQVPHSPPTLLHCSAGVGRTGTILALHILMEVVQAQVQLGISPEFSVFSVVRRMREQRLSMVQTPDQYVLLYSFMAQWLTTLQLT